ALHEQTDRSTKQLAAKPDSNENRYEIALPQILTADSTERPLRLPNVGPVVINEIQPHPADGEEKLEQKLGKAAGDQAAASSSLKNRELLRDKLDAIRISELNADGLPLSEVVKILDREVLKADPEHKGINFILSSAD